MKIACNDSNELRELLKEGKIDVDFIKWPSFSPAMWPLEKALACGKPLLIHGFMNATEFYTGNTTDFKNVDWQLVKKLENEFSLPYYSCHLGGFVSKIQGINWDGISCSAEEEQLLLKQSVENLKQIKKIFKRPIIIENIPVFLDPEGRQSVFFPECTGKPQFISELTEQADVDFLLDIAHARASAAHLKMDIYEYLNQLPLERIVEIHVSGVKQTYTGRLGDFHTEMDELDIDLLHYVLKKTDKLQILTHEFTPTAKDFCLLEFPEGENPYETITPDGFNPKAKDLLEKDLLILQQIKEKENHKSKFNAKNVNDTER